MTPIETQVEEVRVASENLRELYRQNRPVREANAAVRKHNKQIEHDIAKMDAELEAQRATLSPADFLMRKQETREAREKLLRSLQDQAELPFSPSPRNKKLIANECEQWVKLADRSPEGWAACIAELSPTVRVQAANVIWWDWFGGRMSANRWPHLDFYIDRKVTEIPMADLVMALVQLGYSPYRASVRLESKEKSIKRRMAA